MAVKEGTGALKLALRGVLASASCALVMCGGAIPAMADDAGTLAASANVERFQVSARAGTGNNGYNMAGARYNVYNNSGCTGSPVAVLTVQDNTGTTNTVELVAGTYYVKETTPDLTKGFTGYRVSNEVHRMTVTAGNTVTITDATEPMVSGSFSLEKGLVNTGATQVLQGNVTSLANVEFKVEFWTYLYGSVASARASGAADCTVTMKTDANGRITQTAFENGSAITAGTWAYRENGKNVVPCGTIVVTEMDTNNNAFSVASEVGYKVMDYYLNESTMRNSAVGSESVKYVKIANGSLTSTGGSILTVDEPVHFGGLEVTKVDYDRNYLEHAPESKPQGDADLIGITYRISNESKNPVWVLSTCPGILSGSGRATYGGKTYIKFNKGADICEIKSRKIGENDYGFKIGNVFPAGTYKVRETAGTESYQTSNWWRTWSFTKNGYVQKYTTRATDEDGVTGWNADMVTRGGVSVYKDDKDLNESYAQGNTTLAGAVLTVTNKSANDVCVGGTWYEPNEDVGTITTDADGLAASSADWLPYGTYSIRETVAPEGYDLDEEWTKIFTIRENGVVVALGHEGPNDAVKRGGISVQKEDAETGDADAQGDGTVEGTVYAIANASTHDVWVNGKRVAPGSEALTVTTDKNGYAETSKNVLPVGTYKVTEKTPPEGYTLNPDWFQMVTITPSDQGKIVACKKSNQNVPIRAGFFSRKNDAIFGGTPGGDATLEGAEITIKNMSKNRIKTSDGQWVKPGEDIKVPLVTDAAGVFRTPEGYLPYGTYEIRETKAPEGYQLNEDWRATVTIGLDDNGAMIELGPEGEIPEWQDIVSVRLRKLDENNLGLGGDGSDAQGSGTFEGVEFTIVNDSQQSVRYDGKDVAPGEVIGVFKTRRDGLTQDIRLPYGTYKVYESKAPEGYRLNPYVYRLVNHSGEGWSFDETAEANPAL